MATKLQFFETNNGGRSFGNQTTTAKLSQGFKHTTTVSIEKVSVLLYKLGSPTDNVTLEIWDNSGSGFPNAIIPDGAATSIAMSTLTADTAGAWYDFIFPSPPILQANTQYHIVVGRSGGLDNGNNPVWKVQTTGGYGDANDFLGRYDSGSSTWVNYGGDGNFQLWGDAIAFEDFKAEIKSLGLTLQDLKAFTSAEYPTAYILLKAAAAAVALRQEDLKLNVGAVAKVLEDIKAHIQSVALTKENLKTFVQSKDGYPPYLVRYPAPRNGLTNVPVDGTVRFYLRDKHAGVDISKV
ncbi:MAG: hypothetical protein HYW14_02520, partial [Planctomycetes bacterium]|nr:hypothetical protein [Planctomycetota bacterium]